MDLKEYFKKNYQIQMVDLSDGLNKKILSEKIAYLKENQDMITDNEGYYSSEKLTKLILSDKKSSFTKLLFQLEEGKKLLSNSLIMTQLVFFEGDEKISQGSYLLHQNSIYRTSDTDSKSQFNIEGNPLLIFWVNLEYLVFLGEGSFIEALKDSNSLLFHLKQSSRKLGFEVNKVTDNFNSLAYDSGLNINNCLLLDAVYICEDK